jgi:DNA-binding IclR family transcriptional regulator
MADKERYLINSVLRAFKLLEAFSYDRPRYSHTELAGLLDINKSSLTRLLNTLVTAGYLSKDRKTGEYVLASKIVGIAGVYLGHMEIHKAARPILGEIAKYLGETVHLGILDDYHVLYIDKIDTQRSVGMKSYVGRRLPAYSSALGKNLLAWLDEEKLERYLRSVELKSFTPNTITDAAELREHLKMVKRQGYAVDNQENEPHLFCVGAPVFDMNRRAIAAISVAAPSFRIDTPEVKAKSIKAVIEAAKNISQRMGYV